MNSRWIEKEKATVKQWLSTPEHDLLSEFSLVTCSSLLLVFNTPPAKKVGKIILHAAYELQLTAADAPSVIAGDFNHCDIHKIIPSLKQYVAFPTRKNSTIELCYGNIPHVYKSYPLPPTGNYAHDTVKMVPLCRPKIHTANIMKKQ